MNLQLRGLSLEIHPIGNGYLVTWRDGRTLDVETQAFSLGEHGSQDAALEEVLRFVRSTIVAAEVARGPAETR